MTTVASSHGPTEVINARRTESFDAPAILDLVAQRTNAQFGRVNIVHLIEKSNLSVTLSNEENEVLGFAGFLDHPQIEVCDPASWEAWMEDLKYSLTSKTSPLNSLFLHYFVARDDYTIGCASEIVRTVFNAVPELQFIFITLRSDNHLEPALAEIFQSVDKGVPGGHHSLYVCHRHNHIPVLHIRKAVVEDHDDLLPIFKRLNNTLTEDYGNYFLAEMIEAQDEENHAVVAEVGGKAIGFMSICAHVNVDFLQKSYELDSFHGLCKPHCDDILERERKVIKEPTPESVPVKSVVSTPSVSAVQEEQSDNSVRSTSDVMVDKERTGSVSVATDHEQITPAPSQTSVSGSTVAMQPKLSELHMAGGSTTSFIQEESADETEEEVFLSSTSFVTESDREDFKPTYKGDPNAFSIQLFCIDEQYEMRSSDFLPEIFRLFPKKDVAVITVPHLTPEFPLIQQFVRVTPRSRANVPHELYVFHRYGLIKSDFKVRLACTKDYEQVEKLVGGIEMNENLLADLRLFNSARRDHDGTEIQAFVADCLGQVVGICIVRREEDIEHVRSHYNVEDFIYFNHYRRDEHAHLHHFALNPIFQHYSKHFIKEVLRQGHKSCVYYPVYPRYAKRECLERHSLITGINFLVPVRARRQIEYPTTELGINAPSERVMADLPPYALYHINRKLTLEPKVTINARIVVVGASDLGLAFLESMCFCPHLRFNNLTLISRRGLPDTLRSNAHTYSEDDLARLSLRSWVNVVQGNMTGIDRPHKQVIMCDDTRVSFDHLILCTGQQYQIPQPTGADVDDMATNHDLPTSALLRALDPHIPPPENVMALNDDCDARLLFAWAGQLVTKMFTDDKSASVVVYGRTFDAYAAIQLLISRGVPGDRIVLVRPPPHYSPISVSDDECDGDPFNEPVVSATVIQAFEKLGIKVLDDHVLAKWDVEATLTGTKVTSLGFTTPAKPVASLPCLGLVSLHPRRIDTFSFRAANDSCLVFDGRLTIDANFSTNDRSIRAAGPLTKYARRYHADAYWSRHENYSSREIGFRLAMSVLPMFDPTLEGSNELPPLTPATTVKPETPGTAFTTDNPHEKLIPVYNEAKVVHGELPGGYRYLHVRKPGERPPYVTQMNNPDHGREIVTGSPETGNYFRLHINQYRRVETITCLVLPGKVGLPVNNLIRLYGTHERYLNNLLSRVDEGLISDLFLFFREPWCTALFHDRFQDFRQEVRDLLGQTPSGADTLPSIEANVRKLIDEDLVISEEQREDLCRSYISTGQRKATEARLLSFLSYNYYHLPMYAKPGMV